MADKSFRYGAIFEPEEGYGYEFKEITGGTPKNPVKKNVQKYVVAFLNSTNVAQGVIYFGIADDGKVTGLILENSKQRDEIKQLVDAKLREITPSIDPDWVRVDLHKVDDDLGRDLWVLAVLVQQKGNAPVYRDGRGKAWVKTSSGIRELSDSQIEQREKNYYREKEDEQDQDIFLNAKQKWQNYLEELIRRFDYGDNRNLFIPWNVKWEGELVDIAGWVYEFLSSNVERVVFMAGWPGAGKTTFLEWITGSLASQALQELKQELAVDSKIYRPENIIPVFVNLNGFACENVDDINLIAQRLLERGGIWHCLQADPDFKADIVSVLDNPPAHFLVCLDALDEVQSNTQKQTIEAVVRFIKRFQHIKVILTCRTNMIRGQLRDFPVLYFEPLQTQSVEDLFRQELELIADRVVDFLHNHNELIEFISTPLLLNAAVDYWKKVESDLLREQEQEIEPGFGVPNFFAYLLDRVLSWEADKLATSSFDLIVSRWSDELGELAIWLDGRRHAFRYFEATRYVSNSNLPYFRNMGLLREKRGGWLQFVNEVVKMYFAAQMLPVKMEEELEKLHQLYLSEQWWQECVEFAEALYIDVSQLKESHIE